MVSCDVLLAIAVSAVPDGEGAGPSVGVMVTELFVAELVRGTDVASLQ